MLSGYLYVVVLFVLPFMLWLHVRAKPEEDDVHSYLCGGLNLTTVVASLVGTVVGVAFLFSFVTGLVPYYGYVPMFAALAGFGGLFAIGLYKLVRHSEVEEYFREDMPETKDVSLRRPPRTILSFLAIYYGVGSYKFLYRLLTFLVLLLIFVEVSFLWLWLTIVFDLIFPFQPLGFYLLYIVLVFDYVQHGGYRAVLRTDRIQFILLFVVIVFWLAVVWMEVPIIPNVERIIDLWLPPEYPNGFTLPKQAIAIVNGLGVFFFAAFWFLAAPDMWFRLTRAIYAEHTFADFRPGPETRGRKKGMHGVQERIRRKELKWFLALVPLLKESKWFLASVSLLEQLKWFLALVSLLLFIFLILIAVVGIYGSIHRELIDLSPPSWTTGTEAPFFIVRSLVEGLVVLPSFFLEPALTFPNIVGVSVLLVISLAAMTTLDTSLITVAQLRYDWVVNLQRDKDTLESSRRYVRWYLLVALIPLVVQFGGDVIMKDATGHFITEGVNVVGGSWFLLQIATYFGFMIPVVSGGLLFLIVVRIFRTTWLRGHGNKIASAYFMGLVLTVLVFGALQLDALADHPIGLGLFDRNIWYNLGQLAIIEVLSYAGAYMYYARFKPGNGEE